MKLSVPNAVSRRFARQILVTQKHSPTILFAAGIVGVGATVVTACRATLKVEDVLMEIQKDLVDVSDLAARKPEKYTQKDEQRVKAYIYLRGSAKLAKLYGPSVVLGVTSIACLSGSHNILTKRNAGLTAAYAATEKAFQEYRDRVTAELGEDKDREFRYGSETHEVLVEDKNGPKKKTVKKASGTSQYARLFDSSNQNWEPTAEYNLLFLRARQNYANDQLRAKGHLFLNDVYDLLGMERTSAGAVTGWLYDPRDKDYKGDGYVSFGVFKDENSDRVHDFLVGLEDAILLDFNVDGSIWDKI